MGKVHEFWHMEYEEPELFRDTSDSGQVISNVQIRFIGNTGGFNGQGSHCTFFVERK